MIFQFGLIKYFYSFYFLHDQKVTKNLGYIKITHSLLIFNGVRERSSGGSKPEAFPRNTRHERWHRTLHLSLLCIATHMPFAHTSDKNRWRIFLRPIPSERISSFGNLAGQRFSLTGKFTGVKTGLIEILQQM
jgi:hypothetical protein